LFPLTPDQVRAPFGVEIVRKALVQPMAKIASNAGHEGPVVVNKVREGKGAFGFNARTEQYEDLLAAGVIDPAKVVRCALQNAASVASLLLTTEAMVAEKPEEVMTTRRWVAVAWAAGMM
jgi:chaperonin GroEL